MVTPMDNSQSCKHHQDANPMVVGQRQQIAERAANNRVPPSTNGSFPFKVVDSSPMERTSLTSTAGPRLPTADVRQTNMICGKGSWMAHEGRGRGLAGDWIGERRVRGR